MQLLLDTGVSLADGAGGLHQGNQGRLQEEVTSVKVEVMEPPCATPGEPSTLYLMPGTRHCGSAPGDTSVTCGTVLSTLLVLLVHRLHGGLPRQARPEENTAE